MKHTTLILQAATLCVAACELLAGCKNATKIASSESGKSDITLDIHVDSVSLSETEQVLPLLSYVFVAVDSITDPRRPMAYCYNNSTNAIDVLNLADRTFTSTLPLSVDGPDGIPGRIRQISCINGDSLMIYDTLALYFLSKDGHVTSKFHIPEFSRCPVDRNARASAMELRYDPISHIATFPVAAADHTIEIKQYNLLTGHLDSFTLPHTATAAGNSKNYGFMLHPNISFPNDSIITYNYPYSSDIYTYNIDTKTARTIKAPSNDLPDAAPCLDNNDPEEVSWHGFENTHFYPVEYFPALGIYTRMALTGTNMARTANWVDMMNSRKLYLTVFDSNFNTITQVQLPQNRYNPFFGWFNLPHSIACFIDNGNEEASDATRLDIISLNTIPR